MDDCTRDDIAAKLAAALFSKEFPDDAAAIDEHVLTCGRCREEMNALRLIDGFLKEHKHGLRPAVSGCPTVDALVSFAEGRDDDAEIAMHLACCPDCAEYVQLVSDLALQDLPAESKKLTHAQKSFIRDTVAAHYEIVPEPRVSRLAAILEPLRASLSFPSLALGAVAAALLVIVILPQGPRQPELIPLMSDVSWKSSVPTTFKSPLAPGDYAGLRKRVALVLFATEGSGITNEQARDIYQRMDIAKRFGGTYEFLSPRDLRESVSTLHRSHDLGSTADLIVKQTGSAYVLFFEIAKRADRYSLKGTVFDKGGKEKLHILHSGLTLDRVPPLITVIGSELLMEAEYS